MCFVCSTTTFKFLNKFEAADLLAIFGILIGQKLAQRFKKTWSTLKKQFPYISWSWSSCLCAADLKPLVPGYPEWFQETPDIF